MHSVPTLDELSRDPSQLEGLSRQVVGDIALRAAMLCEAAKIRLTLMVPDIAAPNSDDTLTAEDAADLLGIAPNTLYKQRHRQPFSGFVIGTGTRNVRFSRSKIVAWKRVNSGG